MKELEVKAADCSADKLVKTAFQCGLIVKSSSKHYKVTTADNRFVTTIPRHSRLKRELVRGIVKRLNQFGIRRVRAS